MNPGEQAFAVANHQRMGAPVPFVLAAAVVPAGAGLPDEAVLAEDAPDHGRRAGYPPR